MSVIPQPFIQLNQANGAPYAGAKAYFTITGTTTVSPVYQDALFATPHANPVVADSEGRFPAIFAPDDVALRMRITSSTGSLAAPMIDIDPVTALGSGSSSSGAVGQNLAINANFAVSQQNGSTNTSTADDVYDLDQWYSLTQTAACQIQQIIDPENGFTYYRRQTQNQAASQRMGFAQIIEGKKCKHLRGKNATFTPRIRNSSGQQINYAILGWTGSEDTVTSDVVLSWTSSIFTPNNFFLAANVSVLGVGAVTPNADTWTPLPKLTAAMGTSFNNVILLVWSYAVMAQNATLDCDYVMFEEGDVFTGYPAIDPAIELEKCQWHFLQMAFASVSPIAVLSAYATNSAVGPLLHYRSMRVAPSATLIGGANNVVLWDNGASGNNACSTFSLIPRVDRLSVGAAVQSVGAFYTAGQSAYLTAGGSGSTFQLNARL